MDKVQLAGFRPLHDPAGDPHGRSVSPCFGRALLTSCFDSNMVVKALSPRIKTQRFDFRELFQSNGFQTIRRLGHRANF